MNRKKIVFLMALSTYLYGLTANPIAVKAEGTRDMVSNGGYRPYTWATDTTTSGIIRRTYLKVYAKAGEKIYLGSSVAVNSADIIVTNPSGVSTNFDVLGVGKGYINTVAKESAGPLPNEGGYDPYVINVNETGIWKVEFKGNEDVEVNKTNPIFQLASTEFATTQQGTVASWDITVRDENMVEKKGRVFTSYVSILMGNNSYDHTQKVLNSDFYVLTKDGYVYKTAMNGIDPNGFIFFSNNRGFIDKTNNMTLYHTASGNNDTLSTIYGNVSPQLPKEADTDTATDITHNVFFNMPNSDLPQDTLPTNAISPAVASDFKFNGIMPGELNTVVGGGGTFTFNSNKFCSYKLIIDTNKDGKFNAAQDRVIENIAKVGTNTVTWDGKDAKGNIVGVGEYSAQIIMKGGEYHFPLLDAEYNPFGIKVQLLNAPSAFPDGLNKNTVYYDENDYITASSTGNNIILGASGSVIGSISELGGVDSSTGTHAFIGNNGGYGNCKGIDTWTYFPGNAVTISFYIDTRPTVVIISKSVEEDTVIPFATQDFTGKFTDADDDSLSKIQITSLPINGTLKFNGAPVTVGQEISVIDISKLTFTPDANWNGTTSFDWKGNDGKLYSANPAKVNIEITPVNDAPTVKGATATTNQNIPVDGNVIGTDADGDKLTYSKVEDPKNGTVIVSEDGTWSYKPNPGFAGTDSFEVKVVDAIGAEANATVEIVVNNIVPTINDYSEKTPYFTETKGKVDGADVNGDILTYEVAKESAHGKVKVNTDGTWTYMPDQYFKGIDNFKVTVSDGNGGSVTSTITIIVNNGTPIVPSYDRKTIYNKTITGKVEGVDLDEDKLTYSSYSNPQHGAITVNEDGTWKYTPVDGFIGNDSFKVIVNDGNGGTAISTINVTVNMRIDLIGTVTDQETGKLLSNSQIQIKDLGGKVLYTTITDANGNYTIPNIKIGNYRFVVINEKYSTQDMELNVIPTDLEETKLRKDAKLVNFVISLNANPSTIVGDGEQSTVLTTVLVDKNNIPLENVRVTFTAPFGSFINGATAITDKHGRASVVFKSDKLDGIECKNVLVTATVEDKARGLYSSDQIVIVFEPASINGVVVDNETGAPVQGAIVEVTKDFDGDGIIDFHSKLITNADGKYKIAIPKGNEKYELNITKAVKFGDKVQQVTFKQIGQPGNVSGVGEAYDSIKTVAGLILQKQPDGSVTYLDDYTNFNIDIFEKTDFYDENGKIKAINNVSGLNSSLGKDSNDKGMYGIEGLEKGKEYVLAVKYTFPNGQKVIVGTVNAKVSEDGQISLGTALIDPYGTITDSETKELIQNAGVKLYYANTERNIKAGIKPNTLVELPIINGFKPSDNKNPQFGDLEGQYAFMVFPDADYYIVAEKDGYEIFNSSIISVGKEIVKYDFSMKKNKLLDQTKKETTLANKIQSIAESKIENSISNKALPQTGSPINTKSMGSLAIMLVLAGYTLMLNGKYKETNRE